MRRFIAYLTVLLALFGCRSQIEREPAGMDPSLEGRPVTVTFSVPDVRLNVSTKGIEEGGNGGLFQDPYLNPDKLYLVVCGHSQSIKYIRKAEMVVNPSTGEPVTTTVPVSEIADYPLADGASEVELYQFSVQLELSDQDRTIHFLGNIDENRLITGSRSYQILPALLSYEGKQAYWQKVYMPAILPRLDDFNQPVMNADGTYVPSEATEALLHYIPLIRNYAKIQLTDATADEDEFDLYSYAVIYYPKQGSVVPYRSNVNREVEDPFSFGVADASAYRFSGYERCDFSKLDGDLEYPGNLSPTVEFDYDIPDADLFVHPENSAGRVIRYDKDDPDQGFYIYERGIPNANMDPTFVIIRGKFGDSEEYYYYRLDLMETKIVNYESVYQYYPIYRNFRYNILLNRISSVGVSTPEAAAKSSGAEDISADISMSHLSDISNGKTRLVVEPFMSKTYTGPNDEGYYYIYARFFNDINSADPNTEWGSVSVELVPMEDQSENILVLYDDVGNEVQAFYPSSQSMGGEPGFRIVRFNTKEPGNVTRTQKIRITGRNLYTHEDYPLYREVEISLQRKQPMTVSCSMPEMPLQKGAKQEIRVTIPTGLPASMFPLDFTIEAELPTLTPDNKAANNNLPVTSGLSISDNDGYTGKQTIQFIRTLTWAEYNSLPAEDGLCSFSSFFKSNRSRSATTVWVANEYFIKGNVSFVNLAEITGHFYVQATEDESCYVALNNGSSLEYNVDETGWQAYTANKAILLERNHKVAFRSTTTITGWNGGNRFYCYKEGSAKEARNGKFIVGGNIASLIMGDSFISDAESYTGAYSFIDLFKGHVNLVDAADLILPMLTCKDNCYKSMFDGCSSLRRAPKLPATTLAGTCYRNMFLNCASLVEAPYLPAEVINNSCYQRMFMGCSSLTQIKMNSKTYNSGAFTDWVTGVASEGEIWLNPAIKNSRNFENIIPRGTSGRWTVKQLPDGEPWTY